MATASLELEGYEGERKRNGDGIRLLNSKKRKETLFRKCHVLAVKSDADVSLVCIGPDGDIEAWPNHEKVRSTLKKHREKQAEKKKNYSHESESEGKKKSVNESAEKLSAESLMSLWRETDSKLEALDAKIKMLSIQKATDFSDSVNNSSGSFMEVYDWDGLSTNMIESSVQLNPPTQFTEEPMAVPADTDYSFITDNLALNHAWEPEIELLGAQDSTANSLQNYYYLGSDWNRLLQW